jgi:hypothetical protein
MGKMYNDRTGCHNPIGARHYFFVFPLMEYECKYDDIVLDFAGYDGRNMTNKNMLFHHVTKINIVRDENGLNFLLETPLIFESESTIEDIYMHMDITYSGKKIVLHTDNTSDLRLNKLIKKESSIDVVAHNHKSYVNNCVFSFIMSENVISMLNRIKLPINVNIDVPFGKRNFTASIGTHNYIYLLELRDMNEKKDVYKFGRSERTIWKRLKEHCKTSKPLLILEVDDCKKIERDILSIHNRDKKITQRNDLGREYFECADKNYLKCLILKNVLMIK